MSDAMIEQVKELIEQYERLREERLSEADVLEALVARLFRALGWQTDSPLEWNRQKYIREGGYADVALQIDNKPVIFLEAKKLGKIRHAEAQRQPLLAVQQSLFDGEWVPSKAQRTKRAGDRTPEEKQALRYARADVKVKWAILTNFERLLVFDADQERIILAFDTPEEYVDRFEDLKYLQKDQVAKGALDWYKGQLAKAEIDKSFYDFLLEWRKRLAQDMYDEDKKGDKPLFQPNTEENLDLLGQAVQRTLDRLIIIRYADDVGALLRHDQLEGILASYKAKGPYAVEYDLQRDVNTFYRAFYREHDTGIFASPHICEEVRISNETMEALLAGLTNVSFRKFTSDILGNTYESYLGHKLKLVGDKIEVEARRELRKGKGIYYTPIYIVRYIVENTLGKYLYGTVDGKPDGQPEEGTTHKTWTDISDLRVLDPAMGSGSFLIYAFDVLADFYERENKRIEEENAAKWDRWGKEQLQKGMFGKDNEMPTLQATEPNYIEKILQEHLYGVDLDREAVEIAGVNLIMRAFDRLKNGPSREQRKLPLILNQNLKVGNSLISGVRDAQNLQPHQEAITQLIEKRKELTQLRGDEERNKKLEEIKAIANPVNEALNRSLEKCFVDDVEGQRPFNWEVEFPEVFDPRQSDIGHGFTIIVGNPPYGVPFSSSEKRAFRDAFKAGKRLVDSYALFVERAVHLSRDKGRMGYILPNSLLSLEQFEELRELILDHCAVRNVVNLIETVFTEAVISVMVLLLEKEADAAARERCTVLVLDDIVAPVGVAPAFGLVGKVREIPQVLFTKLPGAQFNIRLDKNALVLVSKLEQDTEPLGKLVTAKQGVKTGSKERFILGADSFAKLPRVKSKLCRSCVSGGDIGRYAVSSTKTLLYDVEEMTRFPSSSPRARYEDKFLEPKLLVQHIRNQTLKRRLVLTYDEENLYPLESVYILNQIGDRFDLKYLLGLLNSKLMNFYYSTYNTSIFITGVTMGRLPIKRASRNRQQGLVKLVDLMLDLNRAKRKAEQAFTETLKGYEREYSSLQKAYYEHSEYRGIHIQCQPLIDANEKGEVAGIKVDENPDSQSLRIAGKVTDRWRDIVRLGVADEDFRLFLFFGLRAFLEEKQRRKIWARGRILRGVLEALQAPVLVAARADLNIRRIKQLMGEFERKCPSEALHLSQLEATLHDTDAQIDDLAYDLYGITTQEREIIEASLKPEETSG